MDYHPDKWLLIETKQAGHKVYKIFASFYGGYLSGDSFRSNSGVTHVKDAGSYLQVHGFSGSVYFCRKDQYGAHSYTAQILGGLKALFPDEVRALSQEDALSVLLDLSRSEAGHGDV